MLSIAERGTAQLTVLNHRAEVFHDALAKVKKGETRFHVTDPEGKIPDYDLVYTGNMMLFPEQIRGMLMERAKGDCIYADFPDYDENDTDQICLEFLDQFSGIEIERADEYSVAVARAAAMYTKLPVYTSDERIRWFMQNPDRITVAETLPAESGKTVLRIIPDPFEMGMIKRDWSRLSSAAAFQNLFFWQAFTAGRTGPFRYMEVVLSHVTGIGGILSHMSLISEIAGRKGLLTFLRPGCTRYPDALLCKYVRIHPKPSDATEANTLVMDTLYSALAITWYCSRVYAGFDEHVFTDRFLSEMKEYADAVLGGKRVLGVLARGTDFMTGDLGVERIQASVEQMKPVIQEWMEEGGYEKIFLATEDRDILHQMRAAFPGKVIAVAQERMSVTDLKREGVTLISELERKNREGQAYYDALEDTTVNYFYALYMLSGCEAFLCSGQCNGWDTVRSLNRGRFKRVRKLNVAMDGDPETEKWKEIRPVTAGMFPRGEYPAGRPYYSTLRFDLRERINSQAVKKAWDQTLTVYPYMGYAVGTRKAGLVLLEDPLPFVIGETDRTIEPSGREGNFHTVTFSCSGNTLRICTDQVATDGTGLRYVLETFFYHYFCELDGCEYPVPKGVYVQRDGIVCGQETDAYRMTEPADPTPLLAGQAVKKVFVLAEAERKELFPPEEECSLYCIRIPGEEMRSYTDAVGGCPLSVITVMLARTIQRLHSENTLPVRIRSPFSVRQTMGNRTSLLYQSVYADYEFGPKDLTNLTDESLNAQYAGFLKEFLSERHIRKLCGVYRGVCEGNTKAFTGNMLEKITLRQLEKRPPVIRISDHGMLRTGEYGHRIRIMAAHSIPEKGLTLQMTEAGHVFSVSWYQSMCGDLYVRTMTGLLREAGMNHAAFERVE